MSQCSLLRTGWARSKSYFLPALAAAVIYDGIQGVFGGVAYPLASLAMRMVNDILMRAVRDHLPLTNSYSGVPWQSHAQFVAWGVITLVLGIFLGLRANARSRAQTSN